MGTEDSDDALPKFGRYHTSRILGEGATSSVYLAKDPNLARKVAIKVIKSHLLDSESVLNRFRTEARVVANLRHPNIVQVHDYDFQDDQQYLVMEFVEGPGLQSILSNLDGQAIPQLVSVYIVYQAALGLAAAHKQGLVHRDIKPDNLLLTADGTVKIADFGIAHIAELGMTQVGDILGTPYFMAPEQTMAETPTPQTDLWALGVVMYNCLTGHRPFEGTTFSEIKRKIRESSYQPMRNFVSSLDDSLVKIVDTLLQNAPEDRRNATWLAQQLKKYLDESGILEWEEFIKDFLGTLNSPSLTRTAVEYRTPMVSSATLKNTTRKGTRNGASRTPGRKVKESDFESPGSTGKWSVLKVVAPAFAAGLAVAVGIGFYLQRSNPVAPPVAEKEAHLAAPVAIPVNHAVKPEPRAMSRPPVPQEVPAESPVQAPRETPPQTKSAAANQRSVPVQKPAPAQKSEPAPVAVRPPMKAETHAPEKTALPREESTLDITSSPPWANVFVNGTLVGKTPFNKKVEPGSYRVKVSHTKFPNQDKDSTVQIRAGKYALWFQFRG